MCLNLRFHKIYRHCVRYFSLWIMSHRQNQLEWKNRRNTDRSQLLCRPPFSLENQHTTEPRCSVVCVYAARLCAGRLGGVEGHPWYSKHLQENRHCDFTPIIYLYTSPHCTLTQHLIFWKCLNAWCTIALWQNNGEQNRARWKHEDLSRILGNHVHDMTCNLKWLRGLAGSPNSTHWKI